MKNSDSDYKAEDQGSANQNTHANKVTAKKGGIRLNKKQMIDTANKTVSHDGPHEFVKQQISTDKYNQLLQVKDAEEFSLNYKIFLAKVIKVTDGDTVKVALIFNSQPTKFIMRLNGIDTPQTRKGEAKQFAKKVKQISIGILQGKIVKLETGDFDKYGRILGKIYCYGQGKQFCFNDFLVQQGMAKTYQGKTKNQFTSEDEQEFLHSLKDRTWPKTTHYPLDQF